MTDGHAGIAPGYLLDNDWAEARHRLDLLETIYDPASLRHLDTLGVRPGWSVLELAGGGGSIARSLCDRVGPGGRVVAVDLDTRFLEEIEGPGLEVVRRDLVAEGMPEGQFDLVHCRAFLMHLHERHDLLEAMVGAVRPGGWLLVEEADLGSLEARGSGALSAALEVVLPVMALAGVDLRFARRLPEHLDGYGFEAITCEVHDWLYRGGSPAAQFVQLSLRQLGEKVSFDARERSLIDAAVAELEDPRRWFPPFAMVAAWGRRPS